MEAAERLPASCGCGTWGLIVIDFIDMRDSKRIREVEKTLKDALKADKARVTVGRISQFGMLEMSRQRIKQTLEQGSILDCPHCSGRGKVKGVENMAISFLRKVHAAAKGNAAEVHGSLPLEVAYYLLNRRSGIRPRSRTTTISR
jgi:ribonuclease E